MDRQATDDGILMRMDRASRGAAGVSVTVSRPPFSVTPNSPAGAGLWHLAPRDS